MILYGGVAVGSAPGTPPLGDTWQWGVRIPPPNPTVTVSPVPPWTWAAAAALVVVPPMAVWAGRRLPGPSATG